MEPTGQALLVAIRDASNAQEHVVASTAATIISKVGILSLSNELLSSIALHLCGSRTVLSLSLVNKRLGAIAQDVMLRNLCVSRRGLPQVLNMLGANLDAIPKVYHLDLRRCYESHENSCQCLSTTKVDLSTIDCFRDPVEQNPIHDVTWSRIQKAKHDSNIWYDETHTFLLDTLVASLSSLREVTIWLPPTADAVNTRPIIPLFYCVRASVVPFEGLLLEILQRCLRVLTIRSDAAYKLKTAHVISLPGFRYLRCLTMSMEHLNLPHKIRFYSADDGAEGSQNAGDQGKASRTRLPSTLTDLHLQSCTKFTFKLLHALCYPHTGRTGLKNMTLKFEIPASWALVLCLMQADSGCPATTARTWISMLADLASAGRKVDIYAEKAVALCKDGRKATFTEELQAMTRLTEGEIAKIVRAGMQFSDCLAQDYTGPRSRSSALEYQLFLLHGADYLGLFSSPRFSATSWARSAFFHGAQTDKGNVKNWRKSKSIQKHDEGVASGRRLRVCPGKTQRRVKSSQVHADLSGFVFPISVHCRLSSRLQQLTGPISVRGHVKKVHSASKLHSNRYSGGSKRCQPRKATQSTLAFQPRVVSSTTSLDIHSKFAKHGLDGEDWRAFFQPIEVRSPRHQIKRRPVHYNTSEKAKSKDRGRPQIAPASK